MLFRISWCRWTVTSKTAKSLTVAFVLRDYQAYYDWIQQMKIKGLHNFSVESWGMWKSIKPNILLTFIRCNRRNQSGNLNDQQSCKAEWKWNISPLLLIIGEWNDESTLLFNSYKFEHRNLIFFIEVLISNFFLSSCWISIFQESESVNFHFPSTSKKEKPQNY